MYLQAGLDDTHISRLIGINLHEPSSQNISQPKMAQGDSQEKNTSSTNNEKAAKKKSNW